MSQTAAAVVVALHLAAPVPAEHSAVHLDSFAMAALAGWQQLPAFRARLLMTGNTVVPVDRAMLDSGHPLWTLQLGTGRVEHAPAGPTLHLPLALAEQGNNCVHNGTLTVGPAPAYQSHWRIEQRTCAYFQFTADGALPDLQVSEHPATPADLQALVAWQMELDRHLPVRPVADLGSLADPLGPEVPGVTAWGLVADGVHYSSLCTAADNCAPVLLPGYSLAKALVGGLTLALLEQARPGARQLPVANLVPACANGTWQDVTLQHLADMVPGVFHSTTPDADEVALVAAGFLGPLDTAARSALACRHGTRQAAPGEQFVYTTGNTWLLGHAMQVLWQAAQGPEADTWRDLTTPLFAPLQLSPAFHNLRRNPHAPHQPLTGWGQFFTADDLARVGAWLSLDGLARLFPDPANTGVPAGDSAGFALRYRNGVWALDVGPALDCPGPLYLRFLSGYGGITLLPLPDGRVWYQVGDSGEFRWLHAARALHQQQPFCPAPEPS